MLSVWLGPVFGGFFWEGGGESCVIYGLGFVLWDFFPQRGSLDLGEISFLEEERGMKVH